MTAAKAKAGLVAYIKAHAPHLQVFKCRTFYNTMIGVKDAPLRAKVLKVGGVSGYNGTQTVLRFSVGLGTHEVSILADEVDHALYSSIVHLAEHVLELREDPPVWPFAVAPPKRPEYITTCYDKTYVWSALAEAAATDYFMRKYRADQINQRRKQP